MFGSTILEVAIGVLFVYLLLSLLCSALGELIESFVRFRSRDLKKGIKNLLHRQDLVKDFFNHPLIKPLGENPSYIPARTFSLALWNLATTEAAAGKEGAAGLTQDMDTIRRLIASLDDGKYKAVKISLLILIDQAGNDIEKAQANIEEWYNGAMDRVSGWYKRRVQWILIGIGLLAAASLNIDTINLARVFWYNETLRGSVAAAAENYFRAEPTPIPAPTPVAQGSQGAITVASKPAPVSSSSPAPTPVSETAAPQQPGGAQSPLRKISEIRGEINRLGLPIGWASAPAITDRRYEGLKEAELAEQYRQDLEAYRVDPRRLPQDLNDWFLKVLGIFLTALAVSQGAPFWFDLLNRFVTIRSTVKPREKSTEKPSKERAVSVENQQI
jgi:hypothetical protein